MGYVVLSLLLMFLQEYWVRSMKRSFSLALVVPLGVEHERVKNLRIVDGDPVIMAYCYDLHDSVGSCLFPFASYCLSCHILSTYHCSHPVGHQSLRNCFSMYCRSVVAVHVCACKSPRWAARPRRATPSVSLKKT